MLENSLLESRGQTKSRKPMTVVVSLGAHVLTVGLLVLIPLLQTQAVTIPHVDMSLFLPRLERPKINDVPIVAKLENRASNASADTTTMTTPRSIPDVIDRIGSSPSVMIDAPPLPGLPVGYGPPTLIANVGTAAGGRETAVPVGPPPPPPPPVDAKPTRIGGEVQAAKLLYQVKPVYPALAKVTRTQGIVVLDALISKEGSIESLRVISGHPLLTSAALDAVKQWRYQPTMLDREPVEVVTTITVTFTLQ
jgi:protein TonB